MMKKSFFTFPNKSHSSSLQELERAPEPEQRDMFLSYGRGMTLKPRSCSIYIIAIERVIKTRTINKTHRT